MALGLTLAGARAHFVRGARLLTLPRRHGAQGVLDTASKATLENQFGTSNEDECIIKILEGGSIQETEVRPSLHLVFSIALAGGIGMMGNLRLMGFAI